MYMVFGDDSDSITYSVVISTSQFILSPVTPLVCDLHLVFLHFSPIIMADPDKSIYDRASGPALETVNAHAAPHDLQCFFSWFCPYVFKFRSFLTVGPTSMDRSRGEEG